MKRKSVLCAAGLAMVLNSGCGRQEKQLAYIGASKAKSLALEASGIDASQAQGISADLSGHSGQDFYEVEFQAFGEEYSYDIDALTGVVIQADVPAAGAQSNPDTADGDSGAESRPPGAGMITEQEARERALSHAGLTNDQVTFAVCSMDVEDGKKVFETEFYTADGVEYDYEIDAYTGEVLSYDYDAESVNSSFTDPANEDSRISQQEAVSLALAQVPGASESDILEFETDTEDGRTEYQGKIIYDGMEYEFEIDAYSGAFRSWEAEPLD